MIFRGEGTAFVGHPRPRLREFHTEARLPKRRRLRGKQKPPKRFLVIQVIVWTLGPNDERVDSHADCCLGFEWDIDKDVAGEPVLACWRSD